MDPRLRSVVRLLKGFVSAVAIFLLLAFVVASIASYLAITGKSLALLRLVAARVGTLVAGQRMQQLTLNARLNPQQGGLNGTATVTVQSLEDHRQRFYFLLNDGLHVRHVRVEEDNHSERAASSYQLWLLTVVDVGKPVPKGTTVRLTLDYDGNPATGMFSIASNTFTSNQILLNVDSFWYPTDTQGFFDADVTVTVPASMTVVHNGTHANEFARGASRETHWTSPRPIAGVALVAGQYALTTKDVDGITYRLYLPPDAQLDAARILTLMSHAHGVLQDRYGASGFRQVTLFVDRNLRRGFNDGSGLLGLSIRYFRSGDYGFGTIAHEIAHDWWGGTVAEKWLSPGTGGEWIVEGFAEFSSVVASEIEYGAGALVRRRRDEFFDPDRHGVIAPMSVLDNVMAEANARDTIYRKGAYVALMLRSKLGDEAYFSGLRQFLDRFRLQQVTDRDLQQVLQESSGQDLESYFTDWVRSDHGIDVSLDGNSPSEVLVSSTGTAAIPGDIDLWTFRKAGTGQPERSTVHPGDRVNLADGDYALLDPLLVWADMERENDRYPRAAGSIYVAASSRGDLAVTRGESFPWIRTTVTQLATDGRSRHSWDFNRGLTEPPTWAPDGSRLIVSYSESPDALPAIVTLAAEGAQRTIGHGITPAAAADGAIYAGDHDRIVRFDPAGTESTVVQRRGESLEQPVPSPDGSRIAYSAAYRNHVELRVIGRDTGDERAVLTWDRDRMLYRWSADGTALYAIIGGSWDWQIWQIPLASGPTLTLATGAAAITDLALSPDGSHLAFTAAPDLDYPNARCRLYVMQLSDRNVRTIDVPDSDLGQITWLSSDTIAVVATKADADQRWMLPANSSVKRVHLADGRAEDL